MAASVPRGGKYTDPDGALALSLLILRQYVFSVVMVYAYLS
jgi:hypothetical protein